jgi:hypothetical protein
VHKYDCGHVLKSLEEDAFGWDASRPAILPTVRPGELIEARAKGRPPSQTNKNEDANLAVAVVYSNRELGGAKMHRPGIEPGAGRHRRSEDRGWQRPILPLNHQCCCMNDVHAEGTRSSAPTASLDHVWAATPWRTQRSRSPVKDDDGKGRCQ